jgi:hypothetical protein
MMRLSSISVFAFSLLASVAPAAAQGAWVLWSTYAETRTEQKTSTTQHAIRRPERREGLNSDAE